MTSIDIPLHLPDLAGKRVLHVVQKYSSGVGSAIAQYTRSLPEVHHYLLSGTAVDAEGDLAEQADFAGTYQMTGGTLTKVRRVREVVAELQPDVVHAHSSHGGGYTRLALDASKVPVVYTPHCYGFERQDVPAVVRAGFWAAEALLARNTTAFAACAQREVDLSQRLARRVQRALVPNVAPMSAVRRLALRSGPPLVAGGGRLSPQKDPGFFLDFLAELRQNLPTVEAVWLGDGPDDDRARLTAAGVQVTGWMPRQAALDLLSDSDLYLHSARWEGFPLMVAEAAAVGVPTLVRRLPSFVDIPDQLTVTDSLDVGPAVACLEDGGAAAANSAGWDAVLATHTVTAQRESLGEVYRSLVAVPA